MPSLHVVAVISRLKMQDEVVNVWNCGVTERSLPTQITVRFTLLVSYGILSSLLFH